MYIVLGMVQGKYITSPFLYKAPTFALIEAKSLSVNYCIKFLLVHLDQQ